ncbi:hypothetical protein [Apilactobacillus quenuiae]|uniref:hypothetical protein n=1 Tax=Apilactobacillus quenuiae TaxID=2008377 RepID=UPI000D01E741|nr:hypothetical protein [Apilactobacillus quenuiae]
MILKKKIIMFFIPLLFVILFSNIATFRVNAFSFPQPKTYNQTLMKRWKKRFIKTGYTYRLDNKKELGSNVSRYKNLFYSSLTKPYSPYNAKKIANSGIIFKVKNIFPISNGYPKYYLISKDKRTKVFVNSNRFTNINTDNKNLKKFINQGFFVLTLFNEGENNKLINREFNKLKESKLPKNKNLKNIAKNSIKELKNYIYNPYTYAQAPTLFVKQSD